jgi:hypothetical protein
MSLHRVDEITGDALDPRPFGSRERERLSLERWMGEP